MSELIIIIILVSIIILGLLGISFYMISKGAWALFGDIFERKRKIKAARKWDKKE